MLSLLSEIRFWSTQDDIIIKPTDYSCYKYHTKKETTEQIYNTCKRNYAEQRGLKYILPNKRPDRLKDRLCELEEALLQNKIVCQSWIDNTIQLLLSKGLIITIKLNNSDISSIHFDKTLVPKVQPEFISDAAFNGNQLIYVCKDGRVSGYGPMYKDWVIEGGHRKNLSVGGELLVLWGKTGNEHPQPWSPLAKDHQRANLHLYWIGARGPDLISYRKTDGEPIKVVLSKVNPRSIIVVEQKVTQRGAVSIEVCLLELIGSTLKRSSVTSVPLQTQVSCVSLSKKETYLILGCIDGSLAVLDRNRGFSRIIKASFIPTHVSWHDSEVLAAISNERGLVQYYDTALNCVNIQLAAEETVMSILDISSYFNNQQTVDLLFWGTNDLLILLEQGPIIILTHTPQLLDFVQLVQMYLHTDKTERAIRLLLSWDFNEQAFGGLQKIVAHILRSPLSETSAKQLQDALGSYHSPPLPLSTEIRHKFGPQVKSLTRRFFHQLVRTKMYEMAFLLAVDLGHHDLFMDLYYIAVKIGETEMAAAARAQASALLSQCSSEASNCTRSSCSQCSESSDESSVEGSKDECNSNTSNDNYLSTNFNNPIPKTYKPAYVPPIPNIDLPKIKLVNKPVIAPPLPTTSPMFSSLNSLGIPLNPRPIHRSYNPIPAFNYINESHFIPIRSIAAPPRLPPPPVHVSAPLRMVPPPLPVAPPLIPSTNPSQSIVKKPQAKVKFSDTVTAFIVPEVKRPVRVPPPAHVMDPQKELADSLPLCHPNEDYLKDFTPIRREANDNTPQPKIKVVHFGVV